MQEELELNLLEPETEEGEVEAVVPNHPPVSLRYTDSRGDMNVVRLDQILRTSVTSAGEDGGWYITAKLAFKKENEILNLTSIEPNYDQAVATATEIIRLAHGTLR